MVRVVFDIKRHFSCYGGYRRSLFHVLVHAMFVWPMLFGIMLLLSYTEVLCTKPAWIDRNVPPEINQHISMNFAFVAATFYSVFYIYLDPRAGFLAAILVICCWIGGCAMSKKIQWDPAWKVVLAGEIGCFTGQTLGRGLPEHAHVNALEYVTQMLVLGPYFVLLELLEFSGYRTEVQTIAPFANERCCHDSRYAP